MGEAGLSLMNLVRRCRIDTPVKAKNAASAVDLKALSLWRGCEHKRLIGIAREKDQQGDSSLHRAQNSPVQGARPLKSCGDNILRLVSFVGLRYQAPALIEHLLDRSGQIREGADGETADQVWGRAPVDDNLAGLIELRRMELRLRKRGALTCDGESTQREAGDLDQSEQCFHA